MQRWPVVGHRRAVRRLQLDVIRDDVPHALLLTGPESVGKSTLALTLAQAILCTAEEPEARPCGSCSACRRVDSGNHPDLLLVTPEEAGKGVKIDQIRALERFLALTPIEGRHKIAIISDFEQATVSAANALLKTLEEPPAYAHLILLATDADTLLPTIISRSQHLPLHLLDRSTIQEALMSRWQLSEARAQRLARLSGGRMGWAIQAITRPEHLEEMDEAVEILFRVLRSDLPTRFDIAKELSKDDVRLAQILEYWRTAWRDVLLLKTGNSEKIIYLEQQDLLSEISKCVSLQTTSEISRVLKESLNALDRYANTQLLIEALFLKLPEIPISS